MARVSPAAWNKERREFAITTREYSPGNDHRNGKLTGRQGHFRLEHLGGPLRLGLARAHGNTVRRHRIVRRRPGRDARTRSMSRAVDSWISEPMFTNETEQEAIYRKG